MLPSEQVGSLQASRGGGDVERKWCRMQYGGGSKKVYKMQHGGTVGTGWRRVAISGQIRPRREQVQQHWKHVIPKSPFIIHVHGSIPNWATDSKYSCTSLFYCTKFELIQPNPLCNYLLSAHTGTWTPPLYFIWLYATQSSGICSICLIFIGLINLA